MNGYRKLFYSSAVVLPLLAIAATGVHAASSSTDVADAPVLRVFRNQNLTAEQQAAVEQAQALMKQAHEILEKAGLPTPGKHKMMKPLNLTDEQKALLEQAKTLRKDGKHEEAKALLEKAGLPAMPTFGRGGGHRFGPKNAEQQ